MQRKPTVSAVKGEKLNTELEALKIRSAEFVHQAKQQQDLAHYFSPTETSPPQTGITSSQAQAILKSLMLTIANKPGSEAFMRFYERLKLQQHQANKDTLADIVKNFVEAKDDEAHSVVAAKIRESCLAEIHKRAYTSAKLINKVLLAKPSDRPENLTEAERIGIELAEKYPDIKALVVSAQPELAIHLEKSYGQVLLKHFISELLIREHDKAIVEGDISRGELISKRLRELTSEMLEGLNAEIILNKAKSVPDFILNQSKEVEGRKRSTSALAKLGALLSKQKSSDKASSAQNSPPDSSKPAGGRKMPREGVPTMFAPVSSDKALNSALRARSKTVSQISTNRTSSSAPSSPKLG